MTPIEALDHQACVRPEHTAFISKHEIWTYRRLADEARRAAQALVTRGVQRGDRVAPHMPNVPELLASYYGCMRIGAIACPLGTRMKYSELRPLLLRLRPSLYIGQAQLYPHVADVEPEILATGSRFIVGDSESKGHSWAELLETADDISPPHTIQPYSPAVLLITSGTTGLPKFVTHTPTTLSVMADVWAHLGLRPDDAVLHCLPMVHSSGLYTFMACVHFGARMVLLERFDANATLDEIDAHRCTWLLGLPSCSLR